MKKSNLNENITDSVVFPENPELTIERLLKKIHQLEEDKKTVEEELAGYKKNYGDITDSLDEFVALQKLSETISSTLDENIISESLLKLIGQVIPIEDASVFIMRDQASACYPPRKSGLFCSVFQNLESEGILNWLFDKKGSIILPVEDLMITEDSSWISMNFLLIPLIGFNEGLGAVVALTEKSEDSFSYKDFELINMLAFQAATAFHHARIFKKLKLAHEELKKSQSNMLSTVRMAAVGELSGGIAHEINNPLQVILGHIQLLQLKGSQEKSLTVMMEQAMRISNIVKGLLNFVRQDYSDIYNEYIIPSQVMRKTFELIRGQFEKQNVTVNFDELHETPPIQLNTNYLQQIFLNLLMISKQNLLAGGELKIESLNEDDYIVISIKDDGELFRDDFIHRVQEPFQNLSVGEEPLQLGFAVSIQMIKDISGMVQINSGPEKGNELRMHLPKKSLASEEVSDELT